MKAISDWAAKLIECATFFLLLYLWKVSGMEFVGNVLQFLIWLNIVSAAVFLALPSRRGKLPSFTPRLIVVSGLIDAAKICALLYFSMPVTAAFYAVAAIFMQTLRSGK